MGDVGEVTEADLLDAERGWGGLGIALVTGGLPIIIVFAEFIKYFNFTVTQSPDGLRMKFGLAKTETRTVPPGRVQAIEIVEPLRTVRYVVEPNDRGLTADVTFRARTEVGKISRPKS